MRDPVTAIGRLLLGAQAPAALRQRLLASLSGLLGLRVAFGAISFVSTVVLARLLGGSGFGVYGYALAWVTLLGAPAILGADQLLVREVAAYLVRAEWGLLRGVLRVANRAVLASSFALVFVAAGLGWVLRRSVPHGMLPTFWLSLALIPLISMTRVRQATLQGLHRVVLGSVPERLILPSLFLAFLVAADLWRHSLAAPAAMGLNILATLIAFGVGARYLRRVFPAEAKRAAAAYQTRQWARSAFPILLLSGAGVVFGQADTLILGSLRGATAVGLYGVADRAAELLTFVMVAQNAAFASTVSTLHAQGDLHTLQRLSTRIARMTMAMTLPLAILYLGFGHWFLGLFYGPEYVQAQGALILLSLGQLVNVATGLNGMLLIMTGHERVASVAVGVGAAANIGLNLLLVPRWGMDGAAVANVSSLVILNLLATIALHRRTGLDSTALGFLALRTRE